MKAVKIKTHLDSETLTLKSPKLKPLIGKDIEVIVQESENGSKPPVTGRGFMRGTVLKYDDPFGPAAPLEDWEALR